MLDFYRLTPEDFETLCYEYICNLSQKPYYHVEHTRYIHDGGRDIEVTFYDELSHFKIWAECKQRKRSIGLDEIGKNKSKSAALPINSISRFPSCVGRGCPTSWRPSLHWSRNTSVKAALLPGAAPGNPPFAAPFRNLRAMQSSRSMRGNRLF